MHVIQAHTQGNPNIGLYGYATDAYCILGPEAANLKELAEEALQVPVIITTIAGTSLAGVFLAGTSAKLLVPDIIFDHELAVLKKAGITVEVLETTHTALGNNLVVNDSGALAGPMFSERERADIERALGLAVHSFGIAGIEVVGSSMVVTTKGALIHRDATRFEQDMATDILRLPRIAPGTVNLGVPYVRSGILANSNGFLIGSSSGGPEIANADEALGFLEDA